VTGPAVPDQVPPLPAGEPVRLDAYTGEQEVAGPLAADHRPWALEAPAVETDQKLVPTPARPQEWQDSRIGWGVVLPERPGLDAAALAKADDAGEAIRALVESRPGARVLRYRAGGSLSDWTLRDYAGGAEPLVATAEIGTQPGQLPAYLLLVGSPVEIPWHVQYMLNPVRYVGRLDLDPTGLANYVTALMSDWAGSACRYAAPLTWAVDLGAGDITTLMREAVATPLAERFGADTDMAASVYLDGSVAPATGAALADGLAGNRPALVVTSSHGMTGPLGDPDLMRSQLGMPVDQARAVVRPEDLLAGWQPDGAVWFAQACCSAGSESPSLYSGLFDAGGLVAGVLDGVAGLGASTAPLPRALLGAAKPLRAFVGHVEPTFDWTMRFPPNRQRLTSSLQVALYDRLCSGLPVGLALARHYNPVGPLLFGHTQAVQMFNRAPFGPAGRAASSGALDMAVYSKVTAYDRLSTVILGDPTVAIPVPGAGASRSPSAPTDG
jgi:hypothetical protein